MKWIRTLGACGLLAGSLWMNAAGAGGNAVVFSMYLMAVTALMLAFAPGSRPAGAIMFRTPPARRERIRAAYLAGATIEEIATVAGVTPRAAEEYLRAWCTMGCPK